METKELNTKLRAGMFHTIKSEDFSARDSAKDIYRWKANSGEIMPGLFGGIQLDIASMKLDRFGLNPVILFSHDGGMPIGIGEASKENDVLYMDVAFDEIGLTSKVVKEKVDAGTLKGMSIGVNFSDCSEKDFVWDADFKNVTIKNSELLEASICSIPRDAKALREYSFTASEDTEAATEDEPKDSDTKTDADAEAPAEDTESDKETQPDDASEGDTTKDADSDSDNDTDTEPEKLDEQQELRIKLTLDNEKFKEKLKESEELIEKLKKQVVELSEVMKFTPIEDENKLDDLHGREKVIAAFKQQSKK